MKHILMITTGGTIASAETPEGLTPALSSEELLEYIPEIKERCRITSQSLYHLDSANMRPEYWLNIACKIQEAYDQYDGFVITHGTDTMAYAAAVLYYLIQNSPKPVVLTGAQVPISHLNSDARDNLSDAFLYASDPRACGVRLVFDHKIIDGSRARKTHTHSYNAFSSIDFPVIAVVRGRAIRYYLKDQISGPPQFYRHLDPAVLVVKLIPGMSTDLLDYAAHSPHCHAVIIESFGMGGLPYYNSDEFSDCIDRLIRRDVRVVMTTQVPHEGCDMSIYQVGLHIKQKYALPEAYDMTTEAAVAKIMWALAETHTAAEFHDKFLTPVGYDMP